MREQDTERDRETQKHRRTNGQTDRERKPRNDNDQKHQTEKEKVKIENNRERSHCQHGLVLIFTTTAGNVKWCFVSHIHPPSFQIYTSPPSLSCLPISTPLPLHQSHLFTSMSSAHILLWPATLHHEERKCGSLVSISVRNSPFLTTTNLDASTSKREWITASRTSVFNLKLHSDQARSSN